MVQWLVSAIVQLFNGAIEERIVKSGLSHLTIALLTYCTIAPGIDCTAKPFKYFSTAPLR
jgi:hypothetical protein